MSVNSKLKHVATTLMAITSKKDGNHSWTYMYSSNDNSNGGYYMTIKMAKNFSEDGESAFPLSTNDFSDGDKLHILNVNNYNKRTTET